MANGAVTQVDLKKYWERSDEIDRDLLTYLAYTTSPTSLDLLSILVKTPVVAVLNGMERLLRVRIVSERKDSGKGIYFFDETKLTPFIDETADEEKKDKVLRNILLHYSTAMEDGDEKTIVLAELYRRLNNVGEGLPYIRNAADILYKKGQKERATVYYGYIMENLIREKEDDPLTKDLFEGILDKLPVTDHQVLSLETQKLLLTKAEEAAERSERWDNLAKIKLSLGMIAQGEGRLEEASQYFNDSWKVAERTGDQHILKTAALSLSRFLFWEGRFSEAINRYEKVVGNLEEFGDDEITLTASVILGCCYVMCGRVSRGLGMIDAGRGKAESLGLPNVIALGDIMSALSLIEIRKMPEAERYVNRILSTPEGIHDNYILWAANSCLAYIHYTRNEFAEAYECQKKIIEYGRSMGLIQHRGSHDFEYLTGLEQKGFYLEEMNFELEISKMLGWNNPHTRGVALRYRALKNLRSRESKGRAFLDLRNSEKCLQQSGAQIELARTWIVLGDAYLKEGEVKVAQAYLGKAWEIFSKIDKSLFPADLLVIMMPQEQKIEFMIDRIIDINESLSMARDMSSFLERVINLAMDFVMAMRGAFFILEHSGEPKAIASRNFDPLMLRIEQVNLIKETILAAVKDGKELIMPGIRTSGHLSDTSLREAGIRSLVCMPARLGDKTHGYLYLDNHLGGEPFPENYLPFVRLLCNQIAVGLSNIAVYEETRELKDRFADEAIFYKKEMGITGPTEMIIGKSRDIVTVLDQVRHVAPTDSSVLITGETGVGKELVAKAIHSLSSRKDGPFIPVNLAALPHDLVASELFGHEKGAFTGAHERQKGRFELADGGTIFLDEIGDLPLNVQVKLLRVLQEGTFERLGSAKPIISNFRVIAATNKDLVVEVEHGTFRRDLFYRLNVFPISVPALRNRKEDIALLAEHFVRKFAAKMGKKIRALPAEALKALLDYRWPGNVRELEHFIERAVIVSDGSKITLSTLENTVLQRITSDNTDTIPLADMERQYIEKILLATRWKVSGPHGAASILGMKPTTLLSRMKKLGIKKSSEIEP